MKKIVSIILTLTMLLGACYALSSCGGTENQIKVNPDKQHYVVGICQLVTHDALDAATRGFQEALTAALAAEGRTVEFKYQNAAGDSNTCSTIVNTFVAEDVDLIMANATAALQAAANATLNIPVLGTSITEYGVALELDDFNGTVGGNISGTSDLAPLTVQAQMMIDTLSLKAGDKVGLLYCSAEPNSQYQVDAVDDYLTEKGIVCTHYKFNDSNDLQSITANAADNCKALYVPTDNTAASNTSIINNVCEAKNIPVFTGEEATCAGCGYATLSISYENIGKKTGEMAAKILLGQADITTMAIDYDAAPVKKYNEKACINLGIDVEALKAAGYVVIAGTEAE
jgi:putative ABC transport system substrate-binding protein